MKWLRARFEALLDNLIWFVVFGVGTVLIGMIAAFYNGNPQLTLLWILCLLTVANLVILALIYSRLRFRRISPIHTKHRNTTSEYYDDAFTSGLEIFIVSIMSQHTLREMDARLRKAQASRTRVNVLTLDPNLDQSIVEAIRLHLNEPPYDTEITMRQVKEAWEQWSSFAGKYPDVRVRKYRTIPTLQGILVRDKYASIELLPFDTQTDNRPGLFLTRSEDRELFNLFQDKFIKLWESQQTT